MFVTRTAGADPDAIAPDGSAVHLLSAGERGSQAEFRLAAGRVAAPVRHRTVEELWFVVSGHGALWRSGTAGDEVVDLVPGVSASIPVGTSFQFRAGEGAELRVVGVTMPPWPGDDEAEPVAGPWEPSPPIGAS